MTNKQTKQKEKNNINKEYKALTTCTKSFAKLLLVLTVGKVQT